MQKYLYDFKNDLRNRKIFVCFNGPVSQDMMAELGDVLKRKMKSEHVGRSKVLSVFSMLVEQAGPEHHPLFSGKSSGKQS